MDRIVEGNNLAGQQLAVALQRFGDATRVVFSPDEDADPRVQRDAQFRRLLDLAANYDKRLMRAGPSASTRVLKAPLHLTETQKQI